MIQQHGQPVRFLSAGPAASPPLDLQLLDDNDNDNDNDNADAGQPAA